MSRTHIIGAGLAGLAAAVSLVHKGHAVTLYEASGQAGGRCRSYADAKLDCVIDNGNHLLLSGNKAAMRYLADVRAADALIGPPSACFPFLDLRTGQRWHLRPNAGRLPWWILDARRRVPGTKVRDYFSALRFALAWRRLHRDGLRRRQRCLVREILGASRRCGVEYAGARRCRMSVVARVA